MTVQQQGRDTEGKLSPQYLAGLFDGEGSVGVYLNKNYNLAICIANNYLPILERIKADWEGEISQEDRSPAWYCPAKNHKEFINYIIDSCIIKKRQLELALEFLETKNPSGLHVSEEINEIRKDISLQLKEEKKHTNQYYLEQGRKWEVELADELGLNLVPGSGNQWHSKLDLVGNGARWSLKWTSKDYYTITKKLIEEAENATGGLSGGLETPLWALNIQGHELVVMRKEDFKQIQAGELNVIPEKRTKTAARTHLSNIPILLREQDDPADGYA